MGQRSLILLLLAGACGSTPPSTAPRAVPTDLRERVAQDFERAVLANKDAYVELFDFVAVGEYEILLHRYDLNGRLKNLPDDQKQQFLDEDGTPYPEERERRNVGNFYTFLAQRTVGTGGCTASAPRTAYGKQLGLPFEPLPAATEVTIDGQPVKRDTPAGDQILRTHANAWLENGGVVGIKCTGGKGGLALVYTAKDTPRGYALITIYDD
jgi:hypothetical protein